MNSLGITVVLGLLAGVWAQINVVRPLCDSAEGEEAALVAQDYLNAQHTHGYKYALNRIEDIKIYTEPNGVDTFVLEVDLLETDCHVLDPTPLANCTVRPKVLTAVEGDCDVVLKRVGGVLTVTAFKCKTEESTEDLCMGCPSLLPLNNTNALDFVQASLATFNNQSVDDATYTVMEVGRMTSQIVSGGPFYSAEYVVVEANCTNDVCVPLDDAMAARGICTAKGVSTAHTVDCRMFLNLVPVVDANSTADAAPVVPPVVHVQTGSMSPKHGLRFHQLTTLHNPELSGHLSESGESNEVVLITPSVADPSLAAANPTPAAADPAPATADPAPADPAPADPAPAADSGSASDSDSDSSSKEVPHINFKRDVSDAATQTDPIIVLTPVCPGRKRFF
ncbi:alpha-2-HS-glycoprotein-like isoform X1 [Sebastes umbrosus]|uniref:alpha-2-HS-glycoprotein-like isoform X1 n=1 Tax=Sebastes umbrosus TaxID=72105 RepID=UPI00189E742A|nr:alpha-2-HS-glycoprotein-like isoform X1 [Sebastes umbrosus]